MSFPDDPRDLKVEFAFGSTWTSDLDAATWVQVAPNPDDVSDPGDVLSGVTITRGRIGDAPLVDATQIEFALRNTDGRYSKRNVSGPYYGQLRDGTPVRVSVDVGSGDEILATAFVPEWNPTWRGPDIDDRVNITAEGILALLGRDQEAKSALRRAFEARSDVVAYWHMEDAGGTFASSLPGGTPLTLTGEVDFASAADRAGSAPLPVFTATTSVRGVVSGSFTDRWFFAWLAKFEAVPSARCTLMSIRTTGGSADRWVLEADSTTLYLTAFSAAGATVYSDTFPSSILLLTGSWIGLQVRAVDASAFGLTVFDLSTTSISAGAVFDAGIVAGSIVEWEIPASAELDGVAFGHFGIFTATTPTDILVPNGPEPLNAYVGEAAADRVARVCAEAGIPVDVTAGDSAAMGPQPVGTLLQILRDCEDADHGVLSEGRGGRLAYDPNSSRYNAPVALVLDYGDETGDGDISNLRPFDDNRDVRNRVTVTRSGGSSVTVEERDGPVGTDEIGVKPLPVTLNLHSDDQVRDHAGWLLRAAAVTGVRVIKISPRQLNALHEAGHAVMAALLNVEVAYAFVEETSGGTVTREASDPWREALIAVAGEAVVPRSLSADDLDQALRHITREEIPRAVSVAREMLRPRQAAVEALAKELHRDGRIEGARVVELVADALEVVDGARDPGRG